jgi:hypothetical protein
MQIQEYESIDKLRRSHIRLAEQKCRKLQKGNVPYSDVLQKARNKGEGWSLLLKYKQGLKVTSRKLSRSLHKGDIPTTKKGNSLIEIKDELKWATKEYYKLKKSSKQLRETYLEQLASAVAAKGNTKKVSILKQLQSREAERSTARKIKFLREKLSRTSTYMVSVTLPDGTMADLTEKKKMEKAIITSNKKKFQQSFGTPFYNNPYNKMFGYLGLTHFAKKALDSTLIPPHNASPYMRDFLKQLVIPKSIRDNPTNMDMSIEPIYRFGRKRRKIHRAIPANSLLPR